MLTLTNCLPSVDLDQVDCRLNFANHDPVIRCGNKILIIDDDPVLCLGLHIRLEANSYDTCFANDAESAFNTALSERPDLIILDIGLPDYDGYFVMESLNAFPELADVPIIVLTGRNRFVHEKRCHDAGVKRFFEKPVDDRRLLTAIRQYLG
ncbi:MAG: response regulator [Terriglobales bacterium]|jgi:two-component system KDP operon response regulator KdpE